MTKTATRRPAKGLTRLDLAEAQGTLAVMPPPCPVDAKARGGAVEDYTARAFFEQQPELYRVAVAMLAEHCPHAQIARVIGRPHGGGRNLVAAIARAEMEGRTLEQLREDAHKDARAIQTLAANRMIEMMSDEGTKFAPRDLGALVAAHDKATTAAELLSGGATQRVQHMAEPDGDEFERMLAKAKRARVLNMGIEGGAAGDSRGAAAESGEWQAGARGVDQAGERDGGEADYLSEGGIGFAIVSSGSGEVLPVEPPVADGLGVGSDGGAGAAAGDEGGRGSGQNGGNGAR